jgi:alkanesulfonate monooxygenase SsuD/methylene tetrahydromethanopterin reductase-like flavin-dependent oxidoreductase (luciferase family)
MRFDSGLYSHAGEIRTYPQIEEWREEVRFFDQAGFTTVWVAEHHFFWDGWATPTPTNPILAGADLANQTKRLRIGQCGVCLPDWHPIRVAEDIAMLDHMTKGRVDFGVIKGINGRVNATFHPAADRRNRERNTALFEESLQVVIKAWTQNAFSHKGEFYTFPVPGWKDPSGKPKDSIHYAPDGELVAMTVHPKPYQQPHPPIWQMADSPESHVSAAKMGLNVMCWGRSLLGTKEVWTAYREAASQAQKRQFAMGEGVAMMRPVYVAPTMEEAERDMRGGLNALFENALGASRWGRQAYVGKDEGLSAEDLSCEWFDFLVKHDAVLVGSPDYVAEKLFKFEEELNCQHFVIYMAVNGLEYKKMMRSLNLFVEHVMPRFQT